MSDDVSPAAQPPFDAVPTPPEEPEPAPEAAPKRRRRRPAVWLAAALVGLLVVGQSVAFVVLFGAKLDRLSTPDEKAPNSARTTTTAPAPAVPADGHAKKPAARSGRNPAAARLPVHARHALDFGRESLRDGDLQSARVIAASFLLSLDGRADADRDRESEALALLGQVLAREYREDEGERAR